MNEIKADPTRGVHLVGGTRISPSNSRTKSLLHRYIRNFLTIHRQRVDDIMSPLHEPVNRTGRLRPRTIEWDRQGGMRHQGRLGGSSPGHASAIGTEDSYWQGCFLTPGSPSSSGERAWPKLLAIALNGCSLHEPVHTLWSSTILTGLVGLRRSPARILTPRIKRC
jgi:hypothetical protein